MSRPSTDSTNSSLPSHNLATSTSTSTSTSADNDTGVYRFRGVQGVQSFWEILSGNGGRRPDGTLDLSEAKRHARQMKTLHLYLNEDWHDDYIDDLLTDALESFNEHSGGGETLCKLFIHAQGDFLFTKHVYILAQPAIAVDYCHKDESLSVPVHKILHKFHYGRLSPTIEEKFRLAEKGHFTPITSPKRFLEPLLKLRNIRHVEIDGPMEAALKREIILEISRERRVEFDEGEEENLSRGDVWHLERIPRDGWERKEDQDRDHDVAVSPTAVSNRITLGWPLEQV